MNQLSSEQAEKLFLDYINPVNNWPETVFEAAPVLISKINSLKYKSYVAITTLPELVKLLLKSLLVLDSFIKEAKQIIESKGDYMVADAPNYEKLTFGALKDEYKKKYSDNNSGLHKDLDALNKARNDATHHLKIVVSKLKIEYERIIHGEEYEKLRQDLFDFGIRIKESEK